MLPDSSSRISVIVGCGRALEQGVGGHHQARRAEPALHGAGVDEGPLHVGRRARLGEALDRDDRQVDGAGRQHEARADQLAVDEHAARAALALLARALGAEQPEPLAQHVQQALAEPGVGDVVAGAVDVQRGSARSRRSAGRRRTPAAAGAGRAPRRRGGGRPRWPGGRRSGGWRRAASSPKRTAASAVTTPASQSTAPRRTPRPPAPARSSAPPTRGRGAPSGSGRSTARQALAMAMTMALRTPTLA